MNTDYFFCPNRGCEYWRGERHEGRWYKKDGRHHTRAFGPVQRYRCKGCGKSFSEQTFSLSYYLKRRTDFPLFLKASTSSNSNCFIARDFGLSGESVRIRQDRLARNALFLQTVLLEGHSIAEPLAADGFESYTRSKYYPVTLNLLAGASSAFLYSFTESHSRRKGRVSEAQRQRMSYEYEGKDFSGCGVSAQFTALLRSLSGRCRGNCCTLHTDEHPGYPAALKELGREGGFPVVTHIRTSGKRLRDGSNPLRSVNYLDMLFRKDLANHRRATICGARNDRNMLSRMALYMVTHNFYKPRLITDKARGTAQKHYSPLGLEEQAVAHWKALFLHHRFFLSRVSLPQYFQKIWKRETETPFGENWYPLPKFALQ